MAYSDIVSLIIEKHLFDYINGRTDKTWVKISDDYFVDVKGCRQINITDRKRQRPIKRGEPHKRGKRPSNLRFGSNDFALIGKYEPVRKGDIDHEKGVHKENGCVWLGLEFLKSIDENLSLFTIETVLKGILEDQCIWNPNLEEDKAPSRY